MSKRRRPGKSSRQHHPPRPRRQPDLITDVRRALHSGDSYQLLSLVSGLLTVTDERRQDPFARARGDARVGPTLRELVDSFVDVDIPETTALLAVISEMTGDDMVATLARRELAGRSHPLPPWLTDLTPLTVGRTIEMTHVLRDGDNVAIEVTTAFGEPMTVMVYIDHNLGTLIKDAFVIPEPIDSVAERFATDAADPDLELRPLDPAEARARITEAGEMAAMTYPTFESETWPACRPIVEWVTRQLPPGGTGYVRPEWSERDRRLLTERFFSSPHAAELDAEDRDLFETVLWFGCDYGPGDPLRWSPVAIEMILVDWLPRKVVADADYLGRAPDLLRAYVRFCHEERGIRPSLTTETLEAIDRWEPEFREQIGTGAARWPGGLLERLVGEVPSYEEIMLETLTRAVGGEDALAELDERPLPDEPFEWSGVPPDVSDEVGEVLALCDAYCDEHLDVEYRTACRRLLARVVAGDAGVFRRRARPHTAAAAICWIIGKANQLFRGNVYAKDMLAWFGIKGSASQRATTLLKAAGIEAKAFSYHAALGTPDLLVSSRRAGLISSRDRYRSRDQE